MMLRVRLGFLTAILCLVVLLVVLAVGASSPEAVAQAPAGALSSGLRLGSAQGSVVDANLELVLGQSSDDAEEDITTFLVTLSSTDLELGADDDGAQTVGLRFAGATIPRDTLIIEAHLEFTADEIGSVPTSLVFQGEASDDAATFSSSSGNVSGRPLTSASVNWDNVPAWDTVGGTYLSPNLSSIVQETVNRVAWTPGSAMAFVITGTGRRTAESFNGDPALAPRLHITYQACYSLTISVEPANSGVVTLQPPANCDDGRYLEGTEVQLQAVPAAGHDFVGWGGDASGSANPGTFVMDADKAVVARFAELPSGSVMQMVSQSSDDAEELASTGAVSLKSTDLELGEDYEGAQIVGLRFQDLNIPRGAAISQAYLEFTADRFEDELASLEFRGQAIDDAPTFNRAGHDISGRSGTSASIAWSNVPPWTKAEEVYRSPDLSSIVQEIVSRPGWSSSNSMVFMVTGSGKRAAVSFDGAELDSQPGWVPRLFVHFVGEPACYSLVTSPSPSNGGVVDVSPDPDCDGGKYLEGTEVQLTVHPASDWGFDRWSGDGAGTANSITVTMDSPKVVIANFTQDCYSLSTGLQPAGSGIVQVSPPPGCEGGRYLAGTQLQLSADPGAGHWFAAWSGDAMGGGNPMTLTMTGPKSVTANFVTECFSLTVTLVPTTGGTVSPAPPPNCGKEHYVAGSDVLLTAEPAEDYQFAAWSGDVESSENAVEATIDSAKVVTATFTPDCFGLTTVVSPPGSGSLGIDPPPDCAGDMYTAGTQVRLTAGPAGGKVFSTWSGDAAGSTNPLTVTLDTDLSIAANFVDWCHLLDVSINPTGTGSVDAFPPPNCNTVVGDTRYTLGTQVQLTARPIPGKRFDNWSGHLISDENLVVVTLDTDLSIIANFVDWCYLLDVSINPTGTGSVDAFPPPNCNIVAGDTRYTPGTQVQLTARPIPGKRFDNWSGHLISDENPVVVTLDADKAVTANFGVTAYLPLVLRGD